MKIPLYMKIPSPSSCPHAPTPMLQPKKNYVVQKQKMKEIIIPPFHASMPVIGNGVGQRQQVTVIRRDFFLTALLAMLIFFH